MKRILDYVLLPVLFTLLIISGAVGVFFLLNYLNPFFLSFINDERAVYRALFYDTKDIFPTAYLLHSRILYALAAIGSAFALKVVWRFCRPITSKILPFAKQYKNVFLSFSFVLILAGILFVDENFFRLQGYFPGGRYAGINFANENPPIRKYLVADKRGMAHYEHDSLPNIKFPVQLVLNKQGFPNKFDFDINTVDSLCGLGTNRKEKILFLGDSFLEGLWASKFSTCFIEIYRAQHPEQLVLSTGIPGSDPVQYLLCAEKFIPELLPQKICILFCGWNDAISFDRKPCAYIPEYSYHEGAGVIDNYLPISITANGDSVVPPKKTYFLSRQYYSLFEKTDWISTFCRQSSLTTQLYYFFNPPINDFILRPDSSAAYRNLQKIKSLADSTGTAFSIAFIPTPEMKSYEAKDYKQHFGWVFKDLYPYVHFPPKGLIREEDCVSSSDYHFNDEGQRKFADFLQTTLQHK